MLANVPRIARTPLCLAALMAMTGLAQAQTKAADAPTDGTKLQEVVISAQKRTERVKDTPVAVSVMSAAALEKANASEISDINVLVPSVQLKGTFNGRVPYAMRGISTNANEAAIGLTSGVSVLIDGVPVPSDSMAANELQDIRRVEVLKGPQSTLGGRTASAGVINFVTNTPSNHWTGSLGATLSTDSEHKLNGLVSGPINDMLGFSLSVYDNHREYPIKNLYNGQNSQSNATGGRLKLALKAADDLDLTLALRTAESSSKGETFTYQYLTPGAALFPYVDLAGIAQSKSFPGVNIRYGNTEYYSQVPMAAKVRDNDASLNIEKRFGGYTFTSTTAQQNETIHNLQDVTAQADYFLNTVFAGAPVPPFYNQQVMDIKPSSLTQEFKLASPLDQPVSFVAGLFYSDVKVTQRHEREMFVNVKNDDTTSVTQSLGLYGRVTWNLNSATSLLTGLRLNQDKIAYDIKSYGLNFGTLNFHSAGSDSAMATAGDLTLRHKLDKNNMVYGTYSRGYKPRAFNTAATLTAANSDPNKLAPVEKESIDHFELGSKNTLLGGALNLSAAAFSTTYSNYQVQIYPPGQIFPSIELANAAKARTQGLELDANFAASDNTKLSLNAAYIDARFLQFKNAPSYPGQTPAEGAEVAGFDANGAPVFKQDLSNRPLPDAPKFKVTLGVDHFISAGSVLPWDLTLNGQYAYRTSAVFQANQNPKTQQPGFGILNLSATASSPDGKYSVSLFVNNALNKFYLVNAEDFFSGLYAIPQPAGSVPPFIPGNAVIGQPARDAKRYGGVRFTMNFN